MKIDLNALFSTISTNVSFVANKDLTSKRTLAHFRFFNPSIPYCKTNQIIRKYHVWMRNVFFTRWIVFIECNTEKRYSVLATRAMAICSKRHKGWSRPAFSRSCRLGAPALEPDDHAHPARTALKHPPEATKGNLRKSGNTLNLPHKKITLFIQHTL